MTPELISDELEAMEVRVLRIQPGDTLVLRHAWKMSDTALKHLGEQVQKHWPGIKVVVLEEGMDILLLRDESK